MEKMNSKDYSCQSSGDLNGASKPMIGPGSRRNPTRCRYSEEIQTTSDRNLNPIPTNFDCVFPSEGLLRKSTSVNSKKLRYANILLTDRSSERLIQTFSEERLCMEKTDALLYEYNYDGCFKRLSKGCTLMYCDYNEISISTSILQTTQSYFSISTTKNREHRCVYSDLKGIVLGTNTSTFKLFQRSFGNLSVLGLETYRCITLITENRNYSFGCLNVSQLYDIYLVFSLICANHSHLPSNIPLTKSQFTVYIVKQKIKQMAGERHLYLKEFLLLGIAKTIHLLDYPPDEKRIITKLLDRSFEGPMKLLRLSFKVRPKNYMPTIRFEQNKLEFVRIFYLQGKMATYFKRRIEDNKHPVQWERVKKKYLKIFQLPSPKTIAAQMVNSRKLYVRKENNRESEIKSIVDIIYLRNI